MLGAGDGVCQSSESHENRAISFLVRAVASTFTGPSTKHLKMLKKQINEKFCYIGQGKF
jgi:hypothetical protein